MRIRHLSLTLLMMLHVGRWLSAAAQTQITTGVIEGVVVDASDAVLPGVDVEVRKRRDQSHPRTLVTDREGRFVGLQLPSGRYTVTFKLSGFATLVQENVQVTVGQSARLQPGDAGVGRRRNRHRHQPGGDRRRPAAPPSATTLNEATIGNTPILGRKFEDLLTLTPGVSVVQGPDGDEITFAGQRGVFNNISLDGGDYNNGFFGEQMGGQRAADRHHARSGQRIPGGGHRRQRRVRPHRRRRRQRHHEIGHQSGPKGSLFHFQRLEGLTSNTSDGKPLTDFHREQFGGDRRRTAGEEQGVLLRRGRGHSRAPAAVQPGGRRSARRARSAIRRSPPTKR